MNRLLNSFRPVALFSIMLAALLAISCNPKESTPTPSISLSESVMSFSEKGGTATLSVTATGAWDVSISGTWVTVSPFGAAGDQTVTITVASNETSPKERSSQVVFTCSGKSATLDINQKGADIEDPTLPEAVVDWNFTTSQNGFTIENKNMPSPLTYVWIQDKTYGMKASARMNNVDYDAESWLISPEIDLTERRSAFLSFSHVQRFCPGAPSDLLILKISEDGGTTWKDITIPRYSSGNDWTFVSSGDIDLASYCKKKIKLAFVYNSKSTASPTWEIKTLTISRTPSGETDLGASYKGVPGWLELPKVNDGEKFIIHAVKDGGKALRNYSLIFDTKALVAPWVAYPLCDSYTKKTVSRTDAWQPDPFLKESEQPILSKSGDFYTNGYERGHQIASADRLASKDLNEQTFYYSNMAPMHKGEGFNSGVWGSLEDKVRSWSSSKVGTDTLYVVTGCVTKGSTTTVKDNNDKVVTVPTGFYKALLRYSKTDGYCGAAFYLEHKVYNTMTLPKESILSIDALEEKLGIDFFPNLEALIGKEAADKVEATSPISVDNKFWGF